MNINKIVAIIPPKQVEDAVKMNAIADDNRVVSVNRVRHRREVYR